MKKTTKKQFNEFKQECLRLQKEYGLLEYRLDFELKYLKEDYARIHVIENDCVVMLTLASQIENGDTLKPLMRAKHEMIHLVINRLLWLGRVRCITDEDIRIEGERLTSKLEKII